MVFNRTPLHQAAVCGHLSVVEYLINQKAEIDSKDYQVEFHIIFILLFI